MKTTILIVVCTTLYATLRYNVFKGVAWIEWPVYVLNKVFALSALLLMLIHVLRKARSTKDNGSPILIHAWMLMLLHAGVSFAILTPSYFPKYFVEAKLTWQGGWSMMLGVVVAAVMHQACRACSLGNGATSLIKIGLLAFAAGAHAMLLGYAGWFQPATWPGHMIPITLISFAAGTFALIKSLQAKPMP